jgi:hypothetical protein
MGHSIAMEVVVATLTLREHQLRFSSDMYGGDPWRVRPQGPKFGEVEALGEEDVGNWDIGRLESIILLGPA